MRLSEFSLAHLFFFAGMQSPLYRPRCGAVDFKRNVGVGLGAGVSVGLSEGFADCVAVTVVDGVGVALDAAVIGNTVWRSAAEPVAESMAVAAL
jgi:hypothetical protein